MGISERQVHCLLVNPHLSASLHGIKGREQECTSAPTDNLRLCPNSLARCKFVMDSKGSTECWFALGIALVIVYISGKN